jgi:CBS-domain-containing membrane protein
MMADGGFRHVPVVDEDGSPVGMVSARDALGEDLVDLERDLRLRDRLEGSIGY